MPRGDLRDNEGSGGAACQCREQEPESHEVIGRLSHTLCAKAVCWQVTPRSSHTSNGSCELWYVYTQHLAINLIWLTSSPDENLNLRGNNSQQSVADNFKWEILQADSDTWHAKVYRTLDL